jgi:hypothetical protein
MATPSGRWISRYRASVVRTSDSVSGGLQTDGWPTPRHSDQNQGTADQIAAAGTSWKGQGRGATVATMAQLAGWPTPDAGALNVGCDPDKHMARLERLKEKHQNGNGAGMTLGAQAACVGWPTPTEGDATLLAGWPTPTSKERAGGATTDPDKVLARARGNHSNDLQDFVQLAGWSTPKAEDAESTGFSEKRVAKGHTPDNLHSQTKLLAGWATPIEADSRGSPGTKKHYELAQQAHAVTGWATPANRDYRTPNHHTYAERGGGPKGEQLNNQAAHLIHGASLNGSRAGMGGGGLLNPEFSRWLLGIPEMWPACAPTGMRFRRSSRPKS